MIGIEIYLIIINIVAFVMYGVDKSKAQKKQYRISEKTLILVAVFGGSVGAYLGMRTFRHKTLHPKFSIGVPCIIVVQAVIGYLVLTYLLP